MRFLSFLLVFYIHETTRGSAFNQTMQLNHLRAKRSDSMDDGLLKEGELPEDGLKNARQDGLTEAEKEAKARKALYNTDLFEGDIANPGFSKKFLQDLIKAKKDAKALSGTGMILNGIRDPYFRWPKVGDVVEIPFVLGDEFSYEQRVNIHEAIVHIREKTCVRFVPKSDAHSDYIVIRNTKNACYSSVGRISGAQEMMLGEGCLYEFGIPVHEMMHAIGFFHEMSRADRDDYVDIIWSNVEEGTKDNFEKYDLSYITHLETSYDYESIMHYDNQAFGINGAITIVPKQQGVEIGQRQGLSPNDIYKINKMYDCLGAEPEPEFQLVPNCDDSCVESVKTDQITQSNHECCQTNGFTHAHGCYGLDSNHAGAAVCFKKKANEQQKSSECYNEHECCSVWQQDGECDRNPSYMDLNCKASCGKCQSNVPLDECNNRSPSCTEWANNGECQKNPNWMAENCRQACGKCELSRQLICKVAAEGNSKNKQASTNCLQYSDKDIGIYGENLATQKGQLSECCSICRSTQGCRAYAWNDYEGGTCWLKSVTEPLVDKPGVHVGILRD